MPNKAKLPESMGAQPKTIAQFTFASQDIHYRDAAPLPATHPTKPPHPQGEPNQLKDPLRWVRWHVTHYWDHTNCTAPYGLLNCKVFPSSLLGTVIGDGGHVGSLSSN